MIATADAGSRMIYAVRDLPASARVGVMEVLDISGNSIPVSDLRWSPGMEGSSHVTPLDGAGWNPRPRGVGRPSIVAQYAPQVAEWLREESDLSSAEILRRVRLAGYRGGKSALYELVRRLRGSSLGNPDQKLVTT